MQNTLAMNVARGLAVGLVLAGGLGAARPAGAQELNRPPAGFKALFNGRDLANWQGLIELPKRSKMTPEERRAAQAKADELMRQHWSIENGMLVYDGKGQSLQTAKDYGNFEFYVDWRISLKGDSGIYLRGNPQVQIWERTAGSALDAAGNFIGSGGLYNNRNNPSKPIAVADKPAGEWNTFYIKMVGDRVTVKLNGVLVVDNTPLENYWERGAPLPARGPIELQHHGNRLEFRNIYLKELPDSTALAPAPTAAPVAAAAPAPAPGLVTLTLSKAPLSQVIQLLAANGNADIVLTDPEGKVGAREMAFISLKDQPLDRAIRVVCQAAGLTVTRDPSGIYYLAAR